MSQPFTIAVDFDGTICEYAFPECGPPRGEVVGALRMLAQNGWQIIIHSTRVNSHWPEPGRTEKCEAMVQYLVAHRVPFDSIWGLMFDPLSADQSKRWCFAPHPVGKPVAHVYLDDRAMQPSPVFTSGNYAPEILVRIAQHIAERANAEYEGNPPCRP